MAIIGRFLLVCLVVANLKVLHSVSANNDEDTMGKVTHNETIDQRIDLFTRVDCWPQPVANFTELEEACIQRGCIFDAHTHEEMLSAPPCYFPINTGYALMKTNDESNDMFFVYNNGTFQNPYGADLAFLEFSYAKYAHTLHIRIGQTGRYEPPIEFHTTADVPSNLDLHIDNSSDMFAFKVSRSNGSTPIWDTSIGSFLFSDQYIQIATFLPSDRVFGFGEHAHSSLKHDLSRYTTWGMLARDEMPEYSERPLKNLYGVHPFYLCVESDFSAHGVFFANSAPQEVTLGPGPHLVYRTIGGNLDIYIFEGPTPQMVIEQYLQLVGMPLLPPLWSLGFQIGRNGYASANELDQAVQQTESRGILFNVININMDYMQDFNDFTLNNDWKQLTNITQKWHKQGYKLTIFINTGISVKNPWFKDAIANVFTFEFI